MTENTFDRTFVDVINRLAHALGLQTVAEFVDSEAVLHKLHELGVDYAQGYHLHKPQPVAELVRDSVASPVAAA